jgi:quercetin dioxygenase-like cupin family protein
VEGEMAKRVDVKAYVLGPGEGVSKDDSELKASRLSTAGALTLIESRTTGGAAMHVHSREDEAFYVLDGSIRVRCGKEVHQLGPRSFVFLPRGLPHEWDVVGKVATVLILTVPAGLEEFLREFHEASGKKRDTVSAKYGIEWR